MSIHLRSEGFVLKKILFIFLSLFLLNSLSYAKDPSTRVLLGTSKSYSISPSKGQYSIEIGEQKMRGQKPFKVQFHKQGLLINDKLYKTSYLKLEGVKAFKANGIAYRGDLVIHREKYTLSMVNYVGLEEYLLSVVPAEVYKSWDKEALKAQAVAARTYALYEMKRNRKNKSRKFDLYNDTRSQVYRGISSEHPKTTQAVLSTKGQVLTYNGALVKSYFSSSIGGVSAAGLEIGDNKPYLRPIKSYHSSQNPNKQWTMKIPLTKLQQQYKTSKITQVGVKSRTLSGRIEYIQIKDNKGKVKTVRGDHFRSKLGSSKMKSTLAQVKVSNSGHLVIQGSGFGHGVGMGQWEAQELARRGAKYPQILRHFYYGTKLKKIY